MGPLLSLSTGLVSLQLMIKDDRNAEHYLPARVDHSCQLIRKQAVTLLVAGPWINPQWVGSNTVLTEEDNKIKETVLIPSQK